MPSGICGNTMTWADMDKSFPQLSTYKQIFVSYE